jgi:hypothetical protein
LGFLKAQRWHGSIEDGVRHHGRHASKELAIQSANLKITKGLEDFHSIRDSYIYYMDPIGGNYENLGPTFRHMVFSVIKNALITCMSPKTQLSSISSIFDKADKIYGSVDHIHTGLLWSLEDFNREFASVQHIGLRSKIHFDSWCARRFSDSYAMASPSQVEHGWFIFDDPKKAMLFKLACSDIHFEVHDLQTIYSNVEKEMKIILDIVKPIA